MLLSNKHKFAFVHIPKTGGTSIKAALLPYANAGQLHFEGEKVTDLNGYRPHVKIKRGDHPGKLKFAVVRNPWSWYVSYWKFAKVRNLRPADKQDFDTFIRSLGTPQCKFSKLQSSWVTQGKTLLVDRLLKFESLAYDFKELCQELYLPELELKHYKNAGQYDYREFYTDETREIIEKHCQKDCTMFHYDF